MYLCKDYMASTLQKLVIPIFRSCNLSIPLLRHFIKVPPHKYKHLVDWNNLVISVWVGTRHLNGPRHLFLSFCCTTRYIFEPCVYLSPVLIWINTVCITVNYVCMWAIWLYLFKIDALTFIWSSWVFSSPLTLLLTMVTKKLLCMGVCPCPEAINNYSCKMKLY